jgi:predicted nuclease with TOPRIM domain
VSRPKRWSKAVSEGKAALEELQDKREQFVSECETLLSKVQDSFSELESLKDEYQEWLDGLPENLQGSELGSKLETVTGLDFDCNVDADSMDADDLQSALDQLDEAESTDLPRGFGRD